MSIRNLILNPAILIPLASIFLVYFLIFLKLSNNRKIALILEKITTFFFIFLLINPNVPPFNYLDPSSLAGSDKTFASTILQLGIYAFFIILTRSLFGSFFRSFTLIFRDPFLGILLVLCVLSVLWSGTPLVTFKFSLVQFIVSWFAAHIVSRNNWKMLAQNLRWICLAAAVLSILTILAVPSMGVGVEDLPPFAPRWKGIFPFPIKLGTCMALSVTLWINQLIYSPKQRLVSFGAVTLSFLLLVRSASAQASFTLIILLSILVLLKFIQKFNRKQTVVIVVMLIFVFVVLCVGVTENLEVIFGAFGKDTALTGRAEFWPQMIDALNKRPVLGYGFHGFWQPWRGENSPAGHIININGFIPPNGHNGFLDLALEVGYFGLLLFLLSLILNLVRAVSFWRRSQSNESIFPLIMIAYVIMANISETQLFMANYIWFSYVVVAVRLNSDGAKQPLPSVTRLNLQ